MNMMLHEINRLCWMKDNIIIHISSLQIASQWFILLLIRWDNNYVFNNFLGLVLDNDCMYGMN